MDRAAIKRLALRHRVSIPYERGEFIPLQEAARALAAEIPGYNAFALYAASRRVNREGQLALRTVSARLKPGPDQLFIAVKEFERYVDNPRLGSMTGRNRRKRRV